MKLTERRNTHAPNWELSRIEAASMEAKTYPSARPCQEHGPKPTRYTVNGGCVSCAQKPRKTVDPDYALPGKSGGNRTKGAERRGNHKGRGSAYPPLTITHMAAIRLSDAHFAKALYLGAGNASKGIRLALGVAVLPMGWPSDAPQTRFEAESFVKRKKETDRFMRLQNAVPKADWDDAP